MKSFLEKLREPRPIVGFFAFLPSPAIVEMAALAGFDFVFIDREHSPKDWSCIEHMIRAAEARGLPALVRVSRNDPTEILHALECGADGIIVPRITSPAEARKAVQAMKFAPRGERGACPQVRGASYGLTDYKSFTRDADENRALLLLLEDRDVLEQVEEMATIADSNVLFMVGRSDLAASLGHTGNPRAAPVVELTDRFVERLTALQPKTHVGMGLYEASEVTRWYERGCRFFWYGADISIIGKAFQASVAEIRASTGGRERS